MEEVSEEVRLNDPALRDPGLGDKVVVLLLTRGGTTTSRRLPVLSEEKNKKMRRPI